MKLIPVLDNNFCETERKLLFDYIIHITSPLLIQ